MNYLRLQEFINKQGAELINLIYNNSLLVKAAIPFVCDMVRNIAATEFYNYSQKLQLAESKLDIATESKIQDEIRSIEKIKESFNEIKSTAQNDTALIDKFIKLYANLIFPDITKQLQARIESYENEIELQKKASNIIEKLTSSALQTPQELKDLIHNAVSIKDQLDNYIKKTGKTDLIPLAVDINEKLMTPVDAMVKRLEQADHNHQRFTDSNLADLINSLSILGRYSLKSGRRQWIW